MMDAGRIVLDIKGKEREGVTVEGLLDMFNAGAGKELDNDRILFSVRENKWLRSRKGRTEMEKIQIKYFTDKIEKLRYIDGKSDWIDLRAAQDV